MSSEVKIGILAVVAIFLSFWGFKYIQAKNLLTRSNIYYVYYESVDGLQVGTSVRIRGLEVGSVSSTELQPVEGRVKVTLDLRKEIEIPPATEAVIVSTSIMGGKAIDLRYEQPCMGESCAPSGSTLAGREQGMLEAFLGEGTADGYMTSIKEGMTGAIDSLTRNLLGPESDMPTAIAARDLQATMANLKASTARVDLMLDRSSGNIEVTLASLRSLAQTLEGQRESLANILANADTVSQQLVEADLRKTLDEVNSAMNSLSATLESTEGVMNNVNGIVDQINQGEGTLGQLIKDEELYNKLNSLSIQADSLIEDFQTRPYRYIPFKNRSRVLRYDRKDDALDEDDDEG